jgi:hypothetical protein
MFGMTIPERNVPNLWMCTRAPEGAAGAADVDVICSSFGVCVVL